MADSPESRNNPYRPLNPTELRLVEILPGNSNDRIELNIEVVDLLAKPVYNALSYVWHPRDGTTDGYIPTGRYARIANFNFYPIELGLNLEAAIRYLRQEKGDISTTPTRQVFWIDALCIDQSLPSERNHQVGLMGRIYSSANHVFLWLGPPDYHSDMVVQTLLSNVEDFLSASLELDTFVLGLTTLLCRDWFRRVWIAQELTLARRTPTILVGHRAINWDQFTSFIQLLIPRLNEGGTSISYRLTARAEALQHLADMRHDGPSAPFSQRFFRTTHLQATEPRDKVFGLLGFSTFSGPPIVTDYSKPVALIFAEAVATIMREDFCSYIKLRLWEYKPRDSDQPHTWGDWTPDLQSPWEDRDLYPVHVALPDGIQSALDKTHGIAPILAFSNDLRSVATAGVHLGTIMAQDPITLRHAPPEQYLPNISRYAQRSGTPLPLDKLLAALAGPRHDPILSNQILANALLRLLLTQSALPCTHPCGPWYQRLKHAIDTRYTRRARVFVTDTGHVGVIPYYRVRPSSPRIVAGLFGIGVPFVMSVLGDGRYQLEGVVHVVGHGLGDGNVERMEAGADWKDLVRCGKLDMFSFI